MGRAGLWDPDSGRGERPRDIGGQFTVCGTAQKKEEKKTQAAVLGRGEVQRRATDNSDCD